MIKPLIATAVLAIGVPIGAAAYVHARTGELADQLGEAGGVPAQIGAIDADLTGAIRLSEVALGDLVAADSIEASVALESLLSGELHADEIRVSHPRVDIAASTDGDSDLARVARRLLGKSKVGAAGPAGGGERRLRRIVVSSGSLSARIAGVGELSAEDVELVPDAGGVRVITGPVRVHGQTQPIDISLAFARSAAELSLPKLELRRVLAVGGTGTVTAGSRTLELREVAAGRLGAAGSLELHAAIDDGGVARPIALELSPKDAAVTVRGDRIPLRALAAVAPPAFDLETARATGEVRIARTGSSLQLFADGSFDGVVVRHKAIAGEPIPVGAHIKARLTVTPEAITVSEIGIVLGALDAKVSGWLRRGAPTSGQLEVAIAPAPCADLLAALPDPVRGVLDGMVLVGTLGGTARLAIDLAAPLGDGTVLTTAIANGCRALSEPPAADVTTLTTASDHQYADGSHGRVGPGEATWYNWDRIPPRLRNAFVSAEDGRFFEHDGFDLQQIARSLEIDLRERRLARGGSTISQQLVKNAFLSYRRTFDRKVQEAILTWRLEERLDKKQILTRYLNIIELGPRVFGVGAASKYWFDRSPRELSVKQAAFLAAITSEPSSMSRRVRRAGGLDPQSAERVATILRAMYRDGVISTEDFELAKTQPMYFAAAAIRSDR
ncbi:MAG: transglycosylase domain-containing protein [Myxococcales bacterium]|nr:transglycosylase domain-containing protein [Myxococcales bacterium]